MYMMCVIKNEFYVTQASAARVRESAKLVGDGCVRWFRFAYYNSIQMFCASGGSGGGGGLTRLHGAGN